MLIVCLFVLLGPNFVRNIILEGGPTVFPESQG